MNAKSQIESILNEIEERSDDSSFIPAAEVPSIIAALRVAIHALDRWKMHFPNDAETSLSEILAKLK